MVSLLLRERDHIPGILISLKKSWLELRRLSRHSLEVGLGTPDFMMNALLSPWLEGMEKKGIKVEVNYREENWLVFIFAAHLWAVMWVLLKLLFSRPVLRLGCSVIKSKIKIKWVVNQEKGGKDGRSGY